MRLFRHEYTAGVGSSNADRPMAHLPLAPDMKLNNFRSDTSIISSSASITFNTASAYAAIGSFLLDVDPDTAVAIQTMMDTQLEKASSSVAVDLDEGTADTNPVYQPGEFDMEGLYHIGAKPPRFYEREMLLTLAKAQGKGLNWALDTSANWIAMDHFVATSKRRFSADAHTMAVYFMSLPDWVTVSHSATAGNTPSEQEWFFLQFLDDLIDKAFIDAIAATETGAESPYELINDFLAPHLEESRENIAGPIFVIDAFNFVAHTVWDFSSHGKISGGTRSVHSG